MPSRTADDLFEVETLCLASFLNGVVSSSSRGLLLLFLLVRCSSPLYLLFNANRLLCSTLFTKLPHYHQAFIHYQLHLQASKFHTTRFKHHVTGTTDSFAIRRNHNIQGRTTLQQNTSEPPSSQLEMVSVAMVMSTMEDLMRRMNWTKDEEKMVIIISVTVRPTNHARFNRRKHAEKLQTSVGLTLLFLAIACFGPIMTALRRWRAAWKLSFRRKDHGEVELYEFEETAGSDHGGTNNRGGSADGGWIRSASQ